MEADERLRWLEARVGSSLRPRGEDLRRMVVDEENRTTFLSFCNHSESRCIFVHITTTEKGDAEVIQVSSTPPPRLGNKAMVFLKCSHASKLSRENLAQDVIYTECSTSPLAHLDLVMQDVYLPLMTSPLSASGHAHMGDQLLDLLHRISSSMQITHGYTQGKVVLPLPSVSALANTAAINPNRHSMVVHVLETVVVTWMKQVKMALHCDPSGAISKKCGRYAGPLEEIKFWENRRQTLESVRDQLSSVPILTILHNLEVVHSTYAQGFSHAQHDIIQAMHEAEHCLVYLRTLRPWLLRLHNAQHPDTMISSFSPIMTVLLLVWKHSGYYGQLSAFHRLLTLLTNEIVTKTRDIVDSDLLADPLTSLFDLKLALRVCAAFRGCYLDYKERADTWIKTEVTEQSTGSVVSTGGKSAVSGHTLWPLRNSKVFQSLNAVMERCNDLTELVHTIHDFSELEAVGRGVGVTTSEAVMSDIYTQFTAAVQVFSSSGQDLLILSVDGHFESQFFSFRRKVQQLEKRLGEEVAVWLHRSPSLQTQLRIMEMFKCSSRREAVRHILAPQHRAVVAAILSDVEDVTHTLTSQISRLPLLPPTPPTASRLLWLHGLGERANGAMGVLRSAAPELLEGELGWKLRHVYSELTGKLQSYQKEEHVQWMESIPLGLDHKLTDMVLARAPDGELIVNFDSTLHEVLSEAYHLSRPPLSMRMPPVIKSLIKGMNQEEMHDRRASLELVMQVYRDVQKGMSEEEELLLHSKLQQVETLLSSGELHVDWLSPQFPDFLAKCKAAICLDLRSSLSTLHSLSSTLHHVTQAWSEIPGLDIFAGEGENTLAGLQAKHSAVMEKLNDLLPATLSRIHSSLASVLSSIHASPESPAWDKYLHRVEKQVAEGLASMILTAVGSLLHRAHLYEQGVSIPALMAVQLELVGGVVAFSPPLTPHSSLPSIPEIVARWMDGYVSATCHLPRILPNSQESYQQLLTSDPRVRSALAKVSAHLETNSRQAQTLRKRFSQYCFLWEQDVQQTFRAFLRGEAPPHPQRLSRPETVRSRSSARPHSSSRSKSSQVSMSQASLQNLVPDTTGLNQVMGVSDWDFLQPPGMEPGPDEDTSKRPSLDEFDGELAVFQGIGDRLSSTEDDCNVGWLNVNQRPVKHILNTLVSKWKAVYAGYLERQMSQVLNSLDQFFHEVEPEVERMGGEGDNGLSLMALMAIFNKVNAQQVEMDKKFGAVHRVFAMLDKFSHPLPRRLREQFNTAPNRWANLKKRISLGKQRMGPYIQSQSEIITADLTQFACRYTALHREFAQSKCLCHECDTGRAVEVVRGMTREVGQLQEEACNLIELQELLGTSVFNFSLLNEFQEELSTLSELWTLYDSAMAEHSVWQQRQWKSVDCQEVEEVTTRQMDMVRALPGYTQSWDLYQHLLSYLQTTQLTLPLVEGLRSNAIRPRHWKQVLRYATPSSLSSSQLITRGRALDSSVLEELTLSQLMALQLHVHCSEVEQVVERANKEVAIEALLNTFEEVWLSRQLELVAAERKPPAISRQETVTELGLEGQPSPMTPKPRVSSARVTSAVRRSQSTAKVTSPSPLSPSSPPRSPSPHDHRPLRLLCNTGSIFEILESHQLSLQSVVSTAAAASFTDELQRWQKQLQTIEAVLGVWLQVQALWMQLEVYQSPEVQQHLPAQSFTFSSVDKEWRELLESAASNPSVMTVCLKEGVLVQLEKLQSSLLQCRTTLVGYAEGQRAKCHWFHFIPLDDVLQFVCCGSRLDHLSSLIHKLLPHASGLLYTHPLSPVLPPSSSSPRHHFPQLPRITGVVSHLGEKLELHESVACGGTVENILTSLFSSLHSTLRSQLSTAMTSFVLKSESPPTDPSPFSLLPRLWSSQLSSQVVLLATQLSLDAALKAALQEEDEKDRTSLGKICREMDQLMAVGVKMLRGQQQPETERELDNTSDSAPSAGVNAVKKLYSPTSVGIASVPVTSDQASRLQSVLLAIHSHYRRAVELSQHREEGGSDLLSGFFWQSKLHWTWSSEGLCHLTTLGAHLSYGYHYTGSSGSRLVVTPSTEKALVFLLQAVHQGQNSLMTGPEGSGKRSVVHELAEMMGQSLFSLHCSSHTTTSTLLSCLQGMALTGCWLLLQSVDCLPLATLHTISELLPLIQQARLTNAGSLPWLKDTLTLSSGISPGICFATSSFPRATHLPPELRRVFVSYSVSPPERRVLVEALLLVHQFETHLRLSQTLDSLLTAVDELFNSQFSVAGEGERRTIELSKDTVPSVQSTVPLGLRLLQSIAQMGQRHMVDFEKLGVLQGGPLRDPSTVLSDMSDGARTSLKRKITSLDQTQQPNRVRGSFEELSILFSLKDLLLPHLHDTASISTFILLLTDFFPSCDVAELLAHERQLQEALAVKAVENREAGTSARESRAASAMMVVRDESRHPSEDLMTSLEEHIVQACLLDNLVPSPSFQLAVSQLLCLSQAHPIVAVVGSCCSGKSSVIRVAADTLRGQGEGLTLSWVVPGALDEGQLFGKEREGQWQDGLLPQLLHKVREKGGGTTGKESEGGHRGHWVVLDGALSAFQLDTLLTLLDADRLIKLSNSRDIPVDSNFRFILELPSLESMTPRGSACLPRLCLSPSTVAWWDPVSRWLLTQPSETASALEPLLQRLLSPCLTFLAPVLCGEQSDSKRGGSDVSENSASSIGTPQRVQLSPQHLQLHPIHLVNTCCRILEVCLSSSTTPTSLELLKHQLAYSLVWSMGGHLSPANKLSFDQWWRDTFTETGLALPPGRLVWDYYLNPERPGFLQCSTTLNLVASPKYDVRSLPPFVSTSRACAFAHLVHRLIEQGSPVLVVGDPGSGKTTLLLREFCENIKDTSLQHFYASQFTSGQTFWSCLKEYLEWKWGRNYAPLASKNLVCFIDDLHNSAPSGSLGEVIRGHTTSGGMWDGGEGRWHSVANTSYVCTTHCSGDCPVDNRLAKHCTVLHWDGYEAEDLEAIFSTILSTHLSSSTADVGDVAMKLVRVAVQVHRQMCSLFLPSPKRQHYLFNLRHISGLFRHLCQRCSVEEVTPRDLVLAWQQESWWTYSGALSSEVDRERYWEVVCHALRKHFSQSDLLPELLQLSSYQLTPSQRESLSRQLQHQLLHQPGLHIHLYDNVLEEVHRLCQLISSPFDLNHTVLIGHTHPDPLVQLAAVSCGFTVTQPSLCFAPSLPTTSCSPFGMSAASYNVERFRMDLCTIYTQAGVKNRRMLLLVTSVEMLHESFLGLLHEAVCDGHITHLYPREERTRIINAVRSEVTKAGLIFNCSTAWEFFLSRVRQNLRLVLALPGLSEQPLSVHWRELLSRCSIHYHQPWTQRDLVTVALHHLNANSLLSTSLSEDCAHMLAAIHLQLRARKDLLPAHNCTFEYLAERFVHELQKNHSRLEELTGQLQGGMECVSGARERARQVEEKLAREERVLEEREEAYNKLLVQLGQDTAISKEHGRLVARQKQRVTDLRKIIPEYELGLQMACEEKLSLVLHLKRQVMNLNHSSLTELRAQQRPPQLMEDLMAAIISVIKSPTADLSWTKGAKRLMANIDRFQELLLTQSQMEDNSETILETVGPITNRVALSVDELGACPGGLAATQLLEWVQGVVKLHSILQTRVRPLEARLDAMSSSLRQCEEKLRLQQEKMQVSARRVSGLSEGLENAAVECSRQRDAVRCMKKELQETHEFVEVMSASYVEWEDQLNTANHALSQSLGSLALSLCLPVYLGSVPPHTQLDLVHSVLLPLLRERGVPVAWGGQQLAVGSFCEPITINSDIQTNNDAPTFFSSFPALCRAVLPQLATPTFTAQWLEKAYSLPAVLSMSLAALSWHRSVLLYDPHSCAGHWLKEWKGEELMVVDYRERSLQFYLTIEQALLCGDPMLVENVATPIDPALQPLLEMVHSWDSNEPNTVRFCGRKIQANPRFYLFLTTTVPLSAFPATFTGIVCPLDFSLSQSWVRELLFRTACGVTDSPHIFDKLLCDVVSGEEEARKLEKNLLSHLCTSRRVNYWRLTQKVAGTVTARKEAETASVALRESLSQYVVARTPLIPLASTASLTFDLLHNCLSHPTAFVSLARFKHRMTAALRGEETDGEEVEVLGSLATALQATVEVLSAAAEERKERDSRESKWRAGVLQELMMSIMKDAACVLTFSECHTLACALSILAFIPAHHPPSLLLEQLTYLVQGKSYLLAEGATPPLSPLPSCPSVIPQELWTHLHSIPLSTDYFSCVMSSAHSHTDTEFWAGIEQGKGWSIEEFPWKQGIQEPNSLDDILLLNLFHEPAALQVVSRDTTQLSNSVKLPTLSELLGILEGEKRKPLLLLYDEQRLTCELNLLLLQEELKKCNGGKEVKVMNIAANTDQETCSCLMNAPTAQCLLVTGLCHCDPKWLPLVSIRMQQASDNGCMVVAVVATSCSRLATLSRYCRTALLSNLAISVATHLPPEATQRDGVLPSLLYLLSSLPHFAGSQVSSLPTSSHPLVFHLSLLHCALHHYCKLAGRSPPTLPLFSSSLSLLGSLSHNNHPLPHTVAALQTHMLTLYSSYCSKPVLQNLVSSCLDLTTVVPGSTLTLTMGEYGNLEVVTPGPGLPVTNYGDHAAGIMSSDTHKTTNILSKETLSTAVFNLLIPLLAKLPENTPSTLLPTSPNHLFTTSPSRQHPREMNTTPKIPPTPFIKQSRNSDGGLVGRQEGELKGAEVCGQLPSSHAYLDYIWRKAMDSLFNKE